uniref:Uncharacterized protein n=1 Tax=Micrurus lemniscatus lemniscatus TaxID=129467 RepID=A0A2D4HGM1_MICLE
MIKNPVNSERQFLLSSKDPILISHFLVRVSDQGLTEGGHTHYSKHNPALQVPLTEKKIFIKTSKCSPITCPFIIGVAGGPLYILQLIVSRDRIKVSVSSFCELHRSYIGRLMCWSALF